MIFRDENLYFSHMWTYYRDVTLYNLAITILTSFASAGMYDTFIGWTINALIVFGVFGTGLGVLGFNYFQKNQYYMYHNLGFTKSYLIMRTWLVNSILSIVFGTIIILLV